MAKILKGSEVVESINSKLLGEAKALIEKGIAPTLAILRVGNEADQVAYAKSAAKRCDAVGIAVKEVALAQNAQQETVISSIQELNGDDSVHGVLILRPLPKHISDMEVRSALLPSKDVDGITDASLAGVFSGMNEGFAQSAGFAPCTAKACMEILDHYKIDCEGKRAVVIGRSLVVGKPAAVMLLGKNATVTVCHSKTEGIAAITREADIVIAATGQMESLTGEYFAPGQTVIDVGINWNEEKGKLCGDVNFEQAEPIVAAITPVPGGVGAVTATVLASHVVEAASQLGVRS